MKKKQTRKVQRRFYRKVHLMVTREPGVRQVMIPLLMAVNLAMESHAWLLRCFAETSSGLTPFEKEAILGQIEVAKRILELVRQQIDPSSLQDQSPPFPEA